MHTPEVQWYQDEFLNSHHCYRPRRSACHATTAKIRLTQLHTGGVGSCRAMSLVEHAEHALEKCILLSEWGCRSASRKISGCAASQPVFYLLCLWILPLIASYHL